MKNKKIKISYKSEGSEDDVLRIKIKEVKICDTLELRNFIIHLEKI